MHCQIVLYLRWRTLLLLNNLGNVTVSMVRPFTRLLLLYITNARRKTDSYNR